MTVRQILDEESRGQIEIVKPRHDTGANRDNRARKGTSPFPPLASVQIRTCPNHETQTHRNLTPCPKNYSKTKLKEEFFKILPPTIYFFVALHLVMFIRVLMLEGTGLSPYSSASIAVTALVLGKAVLVADMLPLINRFPNKPLIYNIAWKTVIYLLISAVLHYLERLIDFWRETGSFVAGNEKLLSVIIWPHFFAIQILLFVLIAMYCTVHELVRVIGREKALRIFFGPMPAPQV